MEAVLAVAHFSQMRPPAPTFTEKDLPDLTGKVYVITGSNTGIGKELAQILFSRNAKVYVAARNESKAVDAIESIKTHRPASTGSLEFLHLELDDLACVAKAARVFLSQESRLDVLFNNAGVMHPPTGSLTKQGYELTLGTNNLGHHLFTEILTPLLVQTARNSPAGSVRVVWLGSLYTYAAPKNGMDLSNLNYEKSQDKYYKYNVSKAGAWYEAAEYARKHRSDGIISVAANPGNLKSDLLRHMSRAEKFVFDLILHPTIYGAYTELFAGLSPEVTLDKSGSWIIPWGRFGQLRSDLERGALPVSEGGTGMAQKWTAWCDEQVRQYL
ncbi:NAD(P)-binding protein [Trichoderma chlorosporum]